CRAGRTPAIDSGNGPSPGRALTGETRRNRPFAGCNASRWVGPALPSARRPTQNVLAERGRWRCLLRSTAKSYKKATAPPVQPFLPAPARGPAAIARSKEYSARLGEPRE